MPSFCKSCPAACSIATWSLLLGLLAFFPVQAEESLRIGGKRFTEAYVLVELLGQTAQTSGTPVSLKSGLGNTAIVLAALQS